MIESGIYLNILSHLVEVFRVSPYILKETCMLLESPFHVELNGLCPPLHVLEYP